MASKEPFGLGGTYLSLKPEQATLLDLLSLLFSPKLENRRFIDCSVGLEAAEFRQRWLLFISVLVQKILLALGNSLKIVGDTLEWWLNLLSSNGGLTGLLLNILRGKVIIPDRSSATFMSVSGLVDPRVDLDKSIEKEDAKYKPLLSIMASKFSYENEEYIGDAVRNHWDMDFVGLYNFWNDFEEVCSTQAIIVKDTKSKPNLIVVAFRGTEPFNADDWRTDVDISWYEVPNVGKVHSGFMKALGLQKNGGWPKEISGSDHYSYAYYSIRQELKALLHANGDAKIIVTGHSLGAALAILFVGVLILHEEEWLLEKLEGVYTFGQPRVRDLQFGKFMNDKLRKYDVKYRRYVYCNDMVPRVPYDDRNHYFKHFGACLYFNSLYHGQVLQEEPNKNYFSLFWFIPQILNAVWELVRGFLIPFVKGKDYKDTKVMTAVRLIGLIIPGIPAHLPPNYVDSTRLGSLRGFQDLPFSQDTKIE